MKTTLNNYEKQALDFLALTKTTFKCEFLKHGKHFENDKDTRDIYKITLERGKRSYSFNFGQSINCSGEYQVIERLRNKIWCEKTTGGKYALSAEDFKNLKHIMGIENDILKNPNFSAPTAYGVLACLTKYDPGTFEDFCSEFGYNEDSRTAERTYRAVLDEWMNISILFSDSEIEALQEIEYGTFINIKSEEINP
jgi:hypothetical protein